MFFRAIAIVASIGWFAVNPTAAQTLPAGYELIRVTDTPLYEEDVHINRHGQLVFTANREVVQHSLISFGPGESQ